jgi:neutral trehalase
MYHSCSEDYHHAEMLPTEKEKEDFYINIKSAAESGWDFSSRWFISNGTNAGKIKVLDRLADVCKNQYYFTKVVNLNIPARTKFLQCHIAILFFEFVTNVRYDHKETLLRKEIEENKLFLKNVFSVFQSTLLVSQYIYFTFFSSY